MTPEAETGPVGANATASITITITNPDTWDGMDRTAISYSFAKATGVAVNLTDSWKAVAALSVALTQVQNALAQLLAYR